MKSISNIYIRQAVPADKAFIISLLPRLVEFGLPPWRHAEQMIDTDKRILTGKLEAQPEGTIIFVAADSQHQPLGFIHLQPGSDYYNNQKHGHISDIVIAPEGEGKGIGKKLIEKAEEWAKLQGYEWLTLSVFAQNTRAREVYEHLGYGPDIMKYVKALT